MQPAVERRGAGGTRIPLQLLVELLHEGFDEPFEADGVDLSRGGLAMRAPYLPDVGERLTCRFDDPTGGRVVADAEVVWAQDDGRQSGQFGLKFLEMTPDCQKTLESIVGRGGPGGVYVPPTPSVAMSALPPEPPPYRLRIDGVRSPVVARLVSHEPDGVKLEQELPFLTLDKLVTSEDGRRGRLASVDLALDGEVPRLVLDVVFEEDIDDGGAVVVTDGNAESTVRDATLPDYGPGAAPPPVVSRVVDVVAAKAEATPVALSLEDVHASTGEIVAEQVVAMEQAAAVHEASVHDAVVDALDEAITTDWVPREVRGEAREAFVPAEPTPEPSWQDRPPTPVPSELESAIEALVEPEPEAHAQALPSLPADADARAVASFTRNAAVAEARALLTRIGPAVEAARAQWAVSRAKVGPTWVAFVGHVVRIWGIVREKAGPIVKKVWAFVARFTGAARVRILEVVAERFPRLAPRSMRRRTTAPPPGESNVMPRMRRKKRGAEREPAPKRTRRRTLVISAIAFSAVALGVYALTPGDETADADERVEEPSTEADASEQQVEASEPSTAATTAPMLRSRPAPSTALSAEAMARQAVAPATPVSTAVPTALDAPSREAGPMPRPTFPSVAEGAGQPAAASPYDVDVRTEAGQPSVTANPNMFGQANVPNGESFLIRMSQRVERIEGVALADGFRVTVPGSLSLDRAGPIAASHPLVERSMILNRGDHAELTITFVEGRRPAYRVVGRNSAVEVVVGRR